MCLEAFVCLIYMPVIVLTMGLDNKNFTVIEVDWYNHEVIDILINDRLDGF